MGLFDIFKKKQAPEITETSKENKSAVITEQMVKSVFEILRQETGKEVIHIQANDAPAALTGSKFGGTPYVPKEGEVPVDEEGRQLRLLAQINLQELPKNKMFPERGILQFWVFNDDISGVDFNDLTANKSSRVVLWKEIDTSVTEQEVRQWYVPFCDGEDYFPVNGEMSLTFKKDIEGVTSLDYHFEALFTECWNRKYPDNQIKSYDDIPEEFAEDPYNDISGFGHKLGGYPAFTQWDPRDDKNAYREYQVLLFQMDSELGSSTLNNILWGDSGICNFFITEEDLKQCDFTRVAYTWDCY